MDRKIENDATVVLLEILGILEVNKVVEAIREKQEGTQEEQGYSIINYLFRNVRQIRPQLEELIDLFVDEDVNILKGVALLKDDKEVVSFFTESLGEAMKSV